MGVFEPHYALNVAERLRHFLASITSDELTDEGYKPYVRPQDCAVLMHIHVLGSSVGLIKRLIDLHFDAAAIVIIPKNLLHDTDRGRTSAISWMHYSASGFGR